MKVRKENYHFLMVVGAAVALAGIGDVSADPVPDESAIQSPSEGDQEETTRYVPTSAKWQKDIGQFNAVLRKFVETADLPEEEGFKRRLESDSGWVEVITDGYGGVVDFNAAKGTIQHEANEFIGSGGPYIDWEFELAGDSKVRDDKSAWFAPKIAQIANDGDRKDVRFRFFISIEETDAGPFKAGDRISLRASIDDFSRFKKEYRKAMGLVAIYYLKDAPNPFFELKLDKAEVALVKPRTGKEDAVE